MNDTEGSAAAPLGKPGNALGPKRLDDVPAARVRLPA